MVDAFSNYPMIKNFCWSSSTNKVINQMSRWFNTFGYANYCHHNGGFELLDALRQASIQSQQGAMQKIYSPG